MSGMDSFDRCILSVLRDGKPRDFQQLLREVSFSHNTLRRHLASLERQGFIVKAKKPKKGPGRPSFVYSLPPEIRCRVALTLTEPQTTIVSLTFQRLRHICRFEKGGYCKKNEEKMRSPKLPPNPEKGIKTIFNHFSNRLARECLRLRALP